MEKNTYRQRFTLIEMLIVVGIASLLFALLGPAFTRMTQSNAVEKHASGLKLGMERARAIAVAHKRYVALLFPCNVTDEAKPHYKFQRGGFKLAYVTQDTNGSYIFDGATEDSDWTNRGNNAFITALHTDNDNSKISSEKPFDNFTKEPTGFSDKLHDVISVPYDADGNTCTCRGIIFSPYGNIVMPGEDIEFYLYITGIDVSDCVKLRLNKLSGKVEFVE